MIGTFFGFAAVYAMTHDITIHVDSNGNKEISTRLSPYVGDIALPPRLGTHDEPTLIPCRNIKVD